nr:MAG TPA: hypothetical protein [Caudoviricetes sp.]
MNPLHIHLFFINNSLINFLTTGVFIKSQACFPIIRTSI